MKDKKWIVFSMGILLFPILVFSFVIFEFDSSPDVELNEDMVMIKAPLCSKEKMSFKDITEVRYIETLTYGEKTKGVWNEDIVAGWFENEELGLYYLVSYTECDTHVFIKSNSATFVFNFNTEKETKEAYTTLKEYVDLN